MFINNQELESYVSKHYPKHKVEIMQYKTLLNKMIFFTIGGFMLIVIIFLLLKYL